jgi:hypothetical protein
VISLNLELEVAQSYAPTRSGLSGNGQVSFVYYQVGLQGDGAGNTEHDRPRTRGASDSLAKGTRAGVLQINHVINVAAAPARRIPTETLRAREGRLLGKPESEREGKSRCNDKVFHVSYWVHSTRHHK